jgi:hypothetical protein
MKLTIKKRKFGASVSVRATSKADSRALAEMVKSMSLITDPTADSTVSEQKDATTPRSALAAKEKSR